MPYVNACPFPDTQAGVLDYLASSEWLDAELTARVSAALDAGRVRPVMDPSVEGVWGLEEVATGTVRAVVYLNAECPDLELDEDWWLA